MNELVYWSFMHISIIGPRLVGSPVLGILSHFECDVNVTQRLSKNNLWLGFVGSIDYTRMCLAHSNSPKTIGCVMDLAAII